MNSQGMLEHSANDHYVPVAKRMNSHTLRSVWPMNELMVQTHNHSFTPSYARGIDQDKGPAGVTTYISWYFLVFGLNYQSILRKERRPMSRDETEDGTRSGRK
jgi:hypothetical protein